MKNHLTFFLAAVWVLLAAVPDAVSQAYERVFGFADARAAELASAPNKGANPTTPLVQGNDGNFYGTTSFGTDPVSGDSIFPTIFKLTPAGQLTSLCSILDDSFSAPGGVDEAPVVSGLTLGHDGNFYGTTYSGGASGAGTIFRITPAGTLTTIVEFDDSTYLGYGPVGVTVGRDGNLYGATESGGASGCGTVFKTTLAGEFSTLVEFTGTSGSKKGEAPRAVPVQGSDGIFYGTTRYGGALGLGTIFKVTAGGSLTTLVEFSHDGVNNRGSEPIAALIQGIDGNFYGTTEYGGGGALSAQSTLTSSADTGDTLATARSVSVPLSTRLLVQGQSIGDNSLGKLDVDLYRVNLNAGELIVAKVADFDEVIRVFDSNGVELAANFHFQGNYDSGGRVIVTAPATGTYYVGVTGFPNDIYDPNVANSGDPNYQGTQGTYTLSLDRFPAGTDCSDNGTVFRMTPAGSVTTLIQFTGDGIKNKGSYPIASLFQEPDGVFYGTTPSGGAEDESGYTPGTVFKLITDGTSQGTTLTTLTELDDVTSGVRGAIPLSSLVAGIDGKLYGATAVNRRGNFPGDDLGFGTIYSITETGSFSTLVDFTGNGTSRTGSSTTKLIEGSDGCFYGTTYDGGLQNLGTVFKLTPDGQCRNLVEFSGNGATNKGSLPAIGLTQASDGNFYGVTAEGGAFNDGTFFKVTPEGVLTTLHEFTDEDQVYDVASPIQGSDGNFYGITRQGGGVGYVGTFYQFTPTGEFTTLFRFSYASGADLTGEFPAGDLTEGSDHQFYGATYGGGSQGNGVIFKITTGGSFTKLRDLSYSDPPLIGGQPNSGLVRGRDGDFYGAYFRHFFKINSTGAVTAFGNPYIGSDGPLVQGPDGSFYGAGDFVLNPSTGLNYVSGYVYRVTTAGLLQPLVNVRAQDDGANYPGNLLFGSDGNLYGTHENGVFRVVLPGIPTIYPLASEADGVAGIQVSAKVNARGAATTVTVEYGTDGMDFSKSVLLAANLADYETTLVGAVLTNLSLATPYYYRFRAVSSAGTTVSPTLIFSTLAEPVASVSPATEIASTSARFNGMVDARTYIATASFEWGTDGNSFPHGVAADPDTVAGNGPKPVSAAVAGLPEGGAIFYRLKATNSGGTVLSGVSSFSTVSASTTAAAQVDVGVTEATFKASVNTYGRTASVKFKYWAESSPQDVRETATQTIVSNTPLEVTAHVTGLSENQKYNYQVSVELGGVGTDGSVASLTTQINQAPVTVTHIVFYGGQVVIDPFDPSDSRYSDYDPNNVPPTPRSEGLTVDTSLVTPPNASRAVATVNPDGRSIIYSPQFNVLEDDSLTYRVADHAGASANGQVRFVSFSKFQTSYGGSFVAGSGTGTIALSLGGTGRIVSSSYNWRDSLSEFAQTEDLKGLFDQHGTLTRSITRTNGAVLTFTLALDPDDPRVVHASFEERVGGAVVAAVPSFDLKEDTGGGRRALAGLRTGFIDAPESVADVMGKGFLRMTIGKNRGRGARLAGRLPDGEPYLKGVKASGMAYDFFIPLESHGSFAGRILAVDGSSGSLAMITGEGGLTWKKEASGRARYSRERVNGESLFFSGVAYPQVARGQLPPIGLGLSTPNARLRLSGGNLVGTYRDVLLNILPGSVQIVGPDQTQTGSDVPTNTLQVKVNAAQGKFTGRFQHPLTEKLVPFEGAFRMPFDSEPGQGRGVFRGADEAGTVEILVK